MIAVRRGDKKGVSLASRAPRDDSAEDPPNGQGGAEISPASSELMTGKPRRRATRFHVWRIVAALLTVAAIAWVLLLVKDAWPDIVAHHREIDLFRLAIALGLAIAASWFAFLAFAAIVTNLGLSGYRLREVAHLYFVAQLLKHLPGRMWGIGYQWAASGRAVTLGTWLQANAFHMLFATYFALWSSAITISLSMNFVMGVLIFIAGLVGCILLWNTPKLLGAIAWIGSLVGKRVDSGLASALVALPVGRKLNILVLFTISWVIWYAAWYVNGTAFAPLGGVGGMRLWAYYMVAWFVGYISLFTPSGLGIRELVFVWLAHDFPSDAVLLMAVIGRVSLLLVDLALGLLFAPFAPRARGSS